MGVVLDTSILIADERGKFDMPRLLREFPGQQPVLAMITASELLHGVERAQDPQRRTRRQIHVERILTSVLIPPFDLAQARVHARIWAELESRGETIGAHDLLIAAACLALGHDIATLNASEFKRVTGLRVIDASGYRTP